MRNKNITIALAGNPNAGKTSMFNAMTGGRQHVGNYPGVTVEKKEGRVRVNGHDARLVDLPGTYSLTAYSLEEKVVRDFVANEKPDVVIDVVDASNLERNLYLALQFRELGVPMIIALNMMDVAEKRGLKINVQKLSELMGVPVVSTVARSSKGIGELLEKAVDAASANTEWKPLRISYGEEVDIALLEIENKVNGLGSSLSPFGLRWSALKCLEGDADVLDRMRENPKLSELITPTASWLSNHTQRAHDSEPEGVIAEHRYGFVSAIALEVVTRGVEMRLEISDKIDRVLTNSLIGPLFLIAVLYGTYQFVFWASEAPVGWLESLFGWLSATAGDMIPEGLMQSLVVSGIIDGVGGVLGFVPLIMFMFFAIAILEDTGYMARMAYLLDKLFRIFGLHGSSVIALIVGGGISGGCAVPAVMATRTLNDPKARLATILAVPIMNCGAKLPVYLLLIGAFFAANQANMMFALTLISWSLALIAARILRWTVLKGETAPFVMELPPYRLPSLKSLLIHTWERAWMYIKKAGTIILAISIVIWAMMTFPGLPADQTANWQARIDGAATEESAMELEQALAEAELEHSVAGRIGQALTAVSDPLGFDWRTNVALVGGFAAKEVIVSTLGTAFSMGDVDPEETDSLSERLQKTAGWTPLTAFAMIIFVMVYAPCFVTVAVTAKEAGWKWAIFGIIFNTVIAYLLALGIVQIGRAMGYA